VGKAKLAWAAEHEGASRGGLGLRHAPHARTETCAREHAVYETCAGAWAGQPTLDSKHISEAEGQVLPAQHLLVKAGRDGDGARAPRRQREPPLPLVGTRAPREECAHILAAEDFLDVG
jgi:hypothetical protein